MGSTGKPSQLFQEIRDYITESQEILARGEYLELSDLGMKVERLCSGVANLPQEEGRKHLKELDALMGELDLLQKDLIESRDRLKDELGGVSKHQQAARAYKTLDMTTKPSHNGEDS